MGGHTGPPLRYSRHAHKRTPKTMSQLGTEQRPLRVAIVGSGPSGFYCAAPLLKSDTIVTVDMFDRLPTPFGLVRGGVAPDHPKIRNVTAVYEKTAGHERFRYMGHVHVGQDITIEELRRYYDAIILCYGAETDRRLEIEGEDLPGSHTATSFVGWYNGHPDYRQLQFDLSGESAVVIGVGNVAMDVARILAKSTAELKETDIAQHALDVLAKSNIKDIYVIARRGPCQVKFTTPEIKELGELEDCDIIIEPEELELDPVSEQELSDRNVGRNMEVMRAYRDRGPEGKRKRLTFKFLRSPLEIKGDNVVQSLTLEKNALSGEPFNTKCRGTGETEQLPCDFVFRSIGYRGIAMPGVPFHDAWGIIPNDSGRVSDEQGNIVPATYVAGWIKRGPSGIIGTNKPDSLETANMLLEDLPKLTPCEIPDTNAVLALLKERGKRVVSMQDWNKIDAAEIARGKAIGKPRERFTAIAEMLQVLDEEAQ